MRDERGHIELLNPTSSVNKNPPVGTANIILHLHAHLAYLGFISVLGMSARAKVGATQNGFWKRQGHLYERER